MKKLNLFTADFETTTIVKKPNETQEQYRERVKEFKPEVYSWALCERVVDEISGYDKSNYKIKDGISIFSFIETIEQITKDTVIYFHNGAKFDLHFILPVLGVMGYKQLLVMDDIYFEMLPDELQDEFLETAEVEWNGIIFSDKPRKLRPKEFTILVDGSHKIMEMKLGIESKKRTNGKYKNRAVIFRDSNLMITSTLKGYGESLNKHYNTDKFSKYELDGGYTRETLYKSYDEFVNDGNEREYLHQDVIVLNEFLHLIGSVIPFKKWKMTAAGTAYNIWKYDFFGKKLLERDLNDENGLYTSYKTKSGFINYKNRKTNKTVFYRSAINRLVKKTMPVSWLDGYFINGIEKNYIYLHDAYQGGLTMANPKLAGIRQDDIIYIDINSSYPTQMRTKKFPIGTPEIGDSGNPDDMKIYELDIERVENKKGLPFLYEISSKGSKHYPFIIKNKKYLITDIELREFEYYYQGKYSKTVVASFNSVNGEFYFGEYIDYFYEMKEQASKQNDIPRKLYAKLMLNALYGKFGQDIERESKSYVNGEWISISTVKDASYYLPLAIWITAEARMYLVKAVGDKFENVVGLDTDSLSIKVPKEIWKSDYETIKEYMESNYDVELHPSKLGGWDIEYMVKHMVFRRAKQYIFIDDKGKKTIKFAGLRLNQEQLDKIDFDNFVKGVKGIEQLRPHRLPTGLVLETYEKELKSIWDYDLHKDYWFKDEKDFKNVKNNI